MATTLGKQFGILPKLSLTAQIIGCVLLSAVITGSTLIAARIVIINWPGLQ